MTDGVAHDIEQARDELDQAIDEMRAAIRLCEQMHDRVVSVKSTGELDRLMHASFKEDPIAYSLMAFSNVLVAIDEDTEQGWTGSHLSAALFALERIQSLAEMLAHLGLVSQAAINDSEETVSRLMQMLKAPKGRPN